MPATCGLDFERHLSAPSVDVRRALSEAVNELGFEITVDQLTRIEARRGSMIGYSLMMKQKLPVQAVFEVAVSDDGTGVAARVMDNVKVIGKTWGLNHQYREIFDEVAQRVDARLAKLDPTASQEFTQPRFWSQAADINVLEQGTAVTGKAVGGAVGAADKALKGPTSTTPRVWKGVDSVTFTSSAGVAVETLADAQADLGIAVLIVSHPGSMPAKLAHDVEAFAATLEQRLTAAGGRAAYLEVSDAQKPVLEFLHQQAKIRAELPLRELHICKICRLEKITNPEYQRLAKRNEKLGDIVAGVGATIGKGGISPTFVLGQVFKLKRLDPEYVCSRCQGMEADERVVTYCPKCANLERDLVLRVCPKCNYDFRMPLAATAFWQEPQPVPEPSDALPVPEASPSGSGSSSWPTQVPPPSWLPPAPPQASNPQGAAPQVPPPGWQPPGSWPPPPANPTKGPRAWLGRMGRPQPSAPPQGWPSPMPPAPPATPAPPPAAAPPAPPATATPPPTPASVAWPRSEQVPLGRPQVGSHGKVCQMCRREFPNLWRIVISTPAGYEERFLCGTTVTCQMRSLVIAVQV